MENLGIKILIADDNKALAEMIKKYILGNSDYKVIGITNDGEEELEMIKRLEPDIVITDLKRNIGISGFDVIKKCYEAGIKNTKFLVETAGYYENRYEELKQIGVTHILRKPFDFEDLITEIKNIEEEREKSLTITKNDIQNANQTIWQILKNKIMIMLKKQKV